MGLRGLPQRHVSWNVESHSADAAECVPLVLSKIMRNIAIDRFRKNTAAKKVPSELVCSLEELDECITDGMSVEEEYESREMVRVLNDYLRELPDRSEFIFVCRYYLRITSKRSQRCSRSARIRSTVSFLRCARN